MGVHNNGTIITTVTFSNLFQWNHKLPCWPVLNRYRWYIIIYSYKTFSTTPYTFLLCLHRLKSKEHRQGLFQTTKNNSAKRRRCTTKENQARCCKATTIIKERGSAGTKERYSAGTKERASPGAFFNWWFNWRYTSPEGGGVHAKES